MNISESEYYPINASALQFTQSDIPFKLSPSGFKYLGINVTRTLNSLFSANFAPLMSKIKSDLQSWGNSLIGRINTVKMNILPKFLCLFHCLPIFLLKHFFKTIDQTISDFLGCGKAPRIRKSILQRCKFNGGLSLPNFQLYCWAAHVHKISFCFKSMDLPWCNLEAQSCVSSSSLTALLTSSIPFNLSGFINNQVARSTLKIWYQFRRHFKFKSASILAPFPEESIFPHVAIFGLPEDYNRFTCNQLDIIAFTSLLARRHLLLHWKSTKAPSSTQWLNDTMSFLKLEKIRYSVKGNSEKFYNKWLPFLTFFHSLQSLPLDRWTPSPTSRLHFFNF